MVSGKSVDAIGCLRAVKQVRFGPFVAPLQSCAGEITHEMIKNNGNTVIIERKIDRF